MTATIDTYHARVLLERVQHLTKDLDGKPLNVEGSNNKDLMRANAERSRDLLYAAHLADLARAEILNQYHRFKGQQDVPEIVP